MGRGSLRRTSRMVPYSVLLASRNEGDLLRRTIDSILLHRGRGGLEIIVVDDASADGSLGFLRGPPYAAEPIRVHRNEAHRGLIYSRARAADLARGRYLVFLDAHCAVSPGWLEDMARELAQVADRGLVVPAVYPLRVEDWTLDLTTGRGDGCTIQSPFLDFDWTLPREIGGRLCTCTIGGMAWMCTRRWYRRLGGLDRSMVTWGGENIDFPLRTWLAGGWCLVAPEVTVGHLYQKEPRRLRDDAGLLYNKVRAAHNALSSPTFQRVLGSMLHLPGFREAITRIHRERKSLTPFKDRFEALRRRPDAWVIDSFRLPLREPAFFHLAPRWSSTRQPVAAPRPAVSVVVVAPREKTPGELLSTLLEKTSYGNYEVLLVLARGEGNGLPSTRRDPYRGHPRLRVIHASALAGGGRLQNMAAASSDAEYLAFLPADSVIVDEHWLEKLLLLAEKRPRLLLACPRTRFLGGRAGEDLFEAEWDWEAPLFTRERRGEPRSGAPYQALTAPDTLLFVHRDRFLELGGFERTVEKGPPPLMDLAVEGWLSGLEVFCHPGVLLARRGAPDGGNGQFPPPDAARWRDYLKVLPAVKWFSSPERIRQARERCPRAEPLLSFHRHSLGERRREFLARAKFDDDWLFYKFGIGDPP